jgi:FdhE protein
MACARLVSWWSGGLATTEDYLSRALLRPYVQALAVAGVSPLRPHKAGHCPFCGGAPWIASRRAEADADGAQRRLGCSLCGTEWVVLRIQCPWCGETDPAKLPSFQAEGHPAVRIEACETCGRYLKSLDLTRDARPLPEVDDLVSLAMDLWAIEQGFSRAEPGLAGI